MAGVSNFRFGVCVLVIHSVLAQAETNPPTPIVRLKNGPTIIGKASKTFDEEKVYYSFRGIPFAEPPVGELRFRAPVPPVGDFSNQTIHAFNDGPPCISVSLFVQGSEDCLYLNVYTPQFPQQNASLLPVMVWFYPGAFVNGDGSYATFGPDFFLNEGNVMIVTFNYREGIFGFLSTGDEAAPGNYGLKDQVLALKWVQEHIRYFGGNPDQVTVFGESSGAVSISYLTQSNLTKGLFHRAILESGTSLNSWALTRYPRRKALTEGLWSGIDTSTNQALIDGLRKINHVNLHVQQSILHVMLCLFSAYDGLPFGPSIEPPLPGAIILEEPYQQLKHGGYHEIPYIIGFNSMESNAFLDAFSLPTLIESVIRQYLPTWIGNLLNLFVNFITRFASFNLAPSAVRSLLRIPGTAVSASLNVSNIFYRLEADYAIKSYYSMFRNNYLNQFLSDDLFNRPILEAAGLYSQKAPVYMYRFSYEGSLPSSYRRTPGVGHGEEVMYMWRWRDSYDKKNLPPRDLLTRKRLIKLWTNFARTGNPTPIEDHLLENVKWEPVNANGNLTYLDIGRNLSAGVNHEWDQFQFWKKLFDNFGTPPYATY